MPQSRHRLPRLFPARRRRRPGGLGRRLRAGLPAARIAAEHGVAVASVLLAKLLAAGPHVGLITGARRQASLDASLAAARLVLSRGELESLDEQLSSLPRDTAG
ncbi:aldo/keto reductase [Microbacterium sp. NIBRBAC000506063]|nr:aldo/keto reductase [Microbacterium sp. NIBRBAC000506063]